MRGTHPPDDRVLRYVTAFCPRCHHERPDRPLAEVLQKEPAFYDWVMKGEFPLDTKRKLTEMKIKSFKR